MTQRNSTPYCILVAVYLALPFFAQSQQTLLPPNQPEQDACNALTLCGGKFFTPYSYQGTGQVADLKATPCGEGEDNSMWIKVTVATAGLITFQIIPKDTMDDYDFAVINATGIQCDRLSSSDVVRCNTNNNVAGSNPKGIVGLSDTATKTSIPDGYYGNPFVKAINANAGDVYLIMIDNFGHDDSPGASSGFTIDFSTSTATFVSNSLPAFQSSLRQCSDSSVTVSLNVPVLCSSIAPDGSDFTISPFLPVTSAAGVNCVEDSGYTQQIVVHFGVPAAPGNYVLNAQKGTNGTTILNLCGEGMSLPDALPFTIPPQIQGKFLPPDTTKCNYSTISVIPTRQFAGYTWSTGQNTPSIVVTTPGMYKLRVVDDNTCVGVDSIDIRDSTCPQYVYISNAFTPNGDGRNDKFKVAFAGPTNDFKLAVYDRWGRMVFETTDPFMGWDGTTGGIPQPAGTYAYICIYRLYQQTQQMQRGTVLLIR